MLGEKQKSCLTALSRFNIAVEAYSVGRKMNPPLKGVAVTSVLRALERRGLAIRLPPKDRWGCALWVINEDGRRAVY